MKDPWAEFVNHERRIVAPLHLEARVMAAVRATGIPRRRHHRRLWVAAAASAAMIMAAAWPADRGSSEVRPIASRPIAITLLPQVVSARPPAKAAPGPSRARIHPDVIAQQDDLTAVLLMFDAEPPLSSEPVQMVRLRVRRDALQALGLAVLEPDAAGTVELAVLVGEDGLPRDIRQVRSPQEER
jgi:hypothetical protein